MLQFFKDLRRRQQLKKRELFTYWDGTQTRYGDPFRLWRELTNHATWNMQTAAPLADAGQEPETTQTVNVLCEVFGVRRWDGATRTGLTDFEILNLLSEIADYLDSLKKSTAPSPTQSELTGSASSNSSPVAEQATQPTATDTSFSSDSGKMPTESKPENPIESSEASKLP